jgi:hypothetical protein
VYRRKLRPVLLASGKCVKKSRQKIEGFSRMEGQKKYAD